MQSCLDVVHSELVEAVWHHVLAPLVGAVADARHAPEPVEPSPHAVVNTLGLSPVWLRGEGEEGEGG